MQPWTQLASVFTIKWDQEILYLLGRNFWTKSIFNPPDCRGHAWNLIRQKILVLNLSSKKKKKKKRCRSEINLFIEKKDEIELSVANFL